MALTIGVSASATPGNRGVVTPSAMAERDANTLLPSTVARSHTSEILPDFRVSEINCALPLAVGQGRIAAPMDDERNRRDARHSPSPFCFVVYSPAI
jgi:hypothetical protein